MCVSGFVAEMERKTTWPKCWAGVAHLLHPLTGDGLGMHRKGLKLSGAKRVKHTA